MGWIEKWLSSPRAMRWVVVAAVALTLPTVTLGYMLDDYSHRLMLDRSFPFPGGQRALWDLFRFQDADRSTCRGLLEAGIAPWWTAPDFRLAFFRPLTSLLHAADYTFFPKLPALMHLESIALYAVIVAVVAGLYRRVLATAWVAALAALMFAVDDAHAMVVAWIANRNALLPAAFGFGALLAHVRSRSDGGRVAAVAAPVLFGLALLSAEASVASLVYILAFAICLDDAPRRKRALSLVPYACVGLVWMAVYRALGYGSQGGGFYVDPLRERALYALAVLERAPVLLLAQFAFPPSDLWFAVPARVIPVASIIVGTVVVAGGVLV